PTPGTRPSILPCGTTPPRPPRPACRSQMPATSTIRAGPWAAPTYPRNRRGRCRDACRAPAVACTQTASEMEVITHDRPGPRLHKWAPIPWARRNNDHPAPGTAHLGRGFSIGSLCTGSTGLDMGVAAALEEEAHLAWVADDFHITHLLTHRFPSVGNSGDLLDTVPVRHGMELILVPVPSWLNHR